MSALLAALRRVFDRTPRPDFLGPRLIPFTGSPRRARDGERLDCYVFGGDDASRADLYLQSVTPKQDRPEPWWI